MTATDLGVNVTTARSERLAREWIEGSERESPFRRDLPASGSVAPTGWGRGAPIGRDRGGGAFLFAHCFALVLALGRPL